MKTTDPFINIILPLLAGTAIYWWAKGSGMIAITRHYLPDLLWAYALSSSILIIWKRKLAYKWLVAAFLAGFLFEWLQYLNIIRGTGDLLDLLAYTIGFAVSTLLNKTFKQRYQTKNPIP